MPTEAEQRFINAWRYASPRLEAIRCQELRELDENAGLRMLGADSPAQHPSSGLIHFQAWMMRLRVIQMQERLMQHAGSAAVPND